MADLIENQLDDNLVHRMECRRVDSFFFKSYQHFRLVNDLLSLYSLAKVLASLSLIIAEAYLKQNSGLQLTIWSLLLIPISILQVFYYRLMAKETKNLENFLKIAEVLGHCEIIPLTDLPQQQIPHNIETSVNRNVFDFSNQNSEERDQKKVNILAIQIKYESQKLTQQLQIVSKVSFILYQALHIWGMYIYFALSQNTYIHRYQMIVLIIGTYQYLELYVLAAIGCIVLPIYGLVQLVKLCIAKIKARKFLKKLQPKKFDQAKLKGQPECRICLMAYNAQDKLITLPCDQLHHFHSICIKQWLKMSLSCPLCRENFQLDMQMLQQ